MELYVYRLPGELSDERYAAVLIDFEGLKERVDPVDDGFYVNAKTIPELLRKVYRHLKKEVYLQLRTNKLFDGKEEEVRSRKETL